MARYGHPNEMWRYRALRALKLEQRERALANFRLAARYGDKFSQHALSLMEMDAALRARALLLGEEMYAQYGDAVAKQRMRSAMHRALASATGSRLGFEKDRIQFMAGGGFPVSAIDGLGGSARDYYADERWKPDTYWREQDRQWKARVVVLPPEQLPDPPSDDTAP